ncbi:hypothetical protein N0V90_000361 [Kalmusia sp. IMI 367209]|nr:hypothetical protein N0V90_000361 [Kalmusia sp. IMI 367209]
MSLPPNKASALSMMLKGVKTPNKQPRVALFGKTLLITGSNSGIGLACAKILPTLGLSHLIMAVRSIDKGEAAAAPIRRAYPDCKIELWQIDMLSYSSIQAFAERCKTLPRLDIAILNAGLGSGPTSRINSSTGHEETFQVNFLSTALLSILLLPILGAPSYARSPIPGRLTIVGSGTAFFSSFDNRKEDPLIPSFDIPFSGHTAAVNDTEVIINTVEPGLTSGTSLHRDFTGAGKYLMAGMKKATAKTPEQAAWTYIDAAANRGKESHGGFIMFWEVSG